MTLFLKVPLQKGLNHQTTWKY